MSCKNFLSANEFLVSIKRLPGVVLMAQKINIPSISLSPTETQTPFRAIYNSPDRIDYGDVNITFKVDEYFENYLEVFKWCNDISFSSDFKQYKTLSDSSEGVYSDITIMAVDSNKNVSARINFMDCIPIGLSEIDFEVTKTSIEYVECTLTIKPNGFEFVT